MYSFDARVRYSEADSEGKLTLDALINYFQDCSIFHSEALGIGVKYLQEKHMVWVLSSWQIVVDRYPDFGEEVLVGTFPYDMKGFLGYRNFVLQDKAGNNIAKANTLWSLLDTDTGKPVPVPENMNEAYVKEPKLEMDYAPRKIVFAADGKLQETIQVKKYHLDTNHHVNNGRFVQICMDYLPENFCIGQVRAEYKKQAFLGDDLVPYVVSDADKVCVVLYDREQNPYVITEFLRKK